MKMTEVDFNALVDRAMLDTHVAHMGPVIRPVPVYHRWGCLSKPDEAIPAD